MRIVFTCDNGINCVLLGDDVESDIHAELRSFFSRISPCSSFRMSTSFETPATQNVCQNRPKKTSPISTIRSKIGVVEPLFNNYCIFFFIFFFEGITVGDSRFWWIDEKTPDRFTK